MKYAIEIALNRIIPKEIKSIIATQRTLDILIDGVTENFVVIPMDEMLEVYKEQENLFDYDVIPFAILDDDYLCLYYQNNGIYALDIVMQDNPYHEGNTYTNLRTLNASKAYNKEEVYLDFEYLSVAISH